MVMKKIKEKERRITISVIAAAASFVLVGVLGGGITTVVYAIGTPSGNEPNDHASGIAECNVTSTDPSSHDPGHGPAMGCFHARDDQVYPGGTCEQLAEPDPSNPDDRQGAANFNCGLPSETHGP